MADLVQFLQNFGFPVTLACYLLFRFEKKLDLLEQANEEKIRRIEALTTEQATLVAKVDELKAVIIRRKK